MSLSQLGASVLLPAAKTQLATAAVIKYREVVNKLNEHAIAVDQGNTSLAFRDAKDCALLRLQERKARMQSKLNPLRALHRLRDNLLLRFLAEGWRGEGRQQDSMHSTKPLSVSDRNKSSSIILKNDDKEAAAMEKLVDGSTLLRTAVLVSLGSLCKAFLSATTTVEIAGAERVVAALERRPNQGLITVSNHIASIDDPMVTAALLPPQYLLKPACLRWTLCATDRCFRNAALVPFFRAGKVLPVDRGAGVDQLGMRVASDRLQRGDWIHIFPEGTRGDGERMLPARRGVGWLVCSSTAVPLILPYVHSGMQDIVPRGAMVPRPGKVVRVLVGEPIHVADLIRHAQINSWSDTELHSAIADRVGATLYSLKAKLDGLPLEAVAPQEATAELALQEENLLPLSIRNEYNARDQRWRRRWEALGLSSLAQRMGYDGKSSASSSENSNREIGQLHGQQLSADSLREFIATLTEVSKARARHVQQMLYAASGETNNKSTTSLPDLVA